MKEARRKIQRILNDDWVFIKKIQQSQVRMLEPMKVENCIDAWHRGFDKVLKNLEKIKKNKTIPTKKQKRIAVILPVEYKGGTLRGAKLLAQAIKLGANQAGEDVEVIFCYLEGHYTDEDFSDLPPYIKRRPYEWHLLNQKEAKRTLNYIDLEHTLPSWGYMWINDQMSQLMDCDLLVVVSDRLSFPLLPLKPYVVMAYDYLQRYENFLPEVLNNCFLAAAHAAERVWVTTEFTRTDAIQFAGLSEDKVIKLPMLAPIFSKYSAISTKKTAPPYFVWTTNAALHKNHENAFKALAIYYEKYKGTLECHVTGVDTKYLTTSEKQHLRPLNKIVKNCTALSRNLKLLGNLSESAYQFQLENAQFLWHAGRIDNGTFSVVEAAGLGIPGLSSDYPAMRAIDEQFSLNLHWMDAHIPEDMAIQLKKMEVERNFFQSRLPSHEVIANQSVEKLSDAYWEAVKECL